MRKKGSRRSWRGNEEDNVEGAEDDAAIENGDKNDIGDTSYDRAFLKTLKSSRLLCDAAEP